MNHPQETLLTSAANLTPSLVQEAKDRLQDDPTARSEFGDHLPDKLEAGELGDSAMVLIDTTEGAESLLGLVWETADQTYCWVPHDKPRELLSHIRTAIGKSALTTAVAGGEIAEPPRRDRIIHRSVHH